MNGLVFLAVIGIGTVIGYLCTLLRHGGLLDTRLCLTTGHARTDRYGRCTRCATFPLLAGREARRG